MLSADCWLLTVMIFAMREHATNIVRELRQRGFQAYFAGGCVRDTLLGLVPADYDVATDATPPEVMRIFPQTYAVGAQFGVVLVPAPEDLPAPLTPSEHPNYVEVATFRNDGAYSDGRHPDAVRYSKDPKEDVQRRDFTINGLLMDPSADATTWRQVWYARSEMRSIASRKTNFACCVRCDLRRAFSMSSSGKVSPR